MHDKIGIVAGRDRYLYSSFPPLLFCQALIPFNKRLGVIGKCLYILLQDISVTVRFTTWGQFLMEKSLKLNFLCLEDFGRLGNLPNLSGPKIM